MKQSIGNYLSLNLIIIFMLIVFSILAAALSYYKAFKVNWMISNSIVKYEGYNNLSKEEIDNKLLPSMGYAYNDQTRCSTRKINGKETEPEINKSDYYYCVYRNEDQGSDSVDLSKDAEYYSYTIVTYIYIDFPLINQLKIPIVSTSDRIYLFGTK